MRLGVCVSVCTPHFKYNRKPIYFVQVKCLREKKFALWFSTKNLRRGAWLTLTKLRTRCRKTNGCCCRQTGPDSQTARHPCIRNDNSYGFDGEMAQKKKTKKKCQATGAGDGAKKQATCLRMAMRVVVHRSRIAGNSLTQLIQLTHSPGRSLAHSQ